MLTLSVLTLKSERSTMQLVAERKKDGAATYVLINDGKSKKNQRGMTTHHATFEAARAHLGVMAEAAVRAGWSRPAGRRGFVAKPDAFDKMPAPGKGKKS